MDVVGSNPAVPTEKGDMVKLSKKKWAVRFFDPDEDCFYGAPYHRYIGPNGETSREDVKEWHFEDICINATVEANRRKQREDEIRDGVKEGSYKKLCYIGGPFDTLELVEIK